MADVSEIAIPVEAATAAALADPRRRAAIGSLIDRLVQPHSNDPLVALLEVTSTAARKAGLTAADVDAELAAHKAERRV